MSNVTYVAGFLFQRDMVLLVQKKRPDWQAGLWNAVGGKVEEDETAETAMRREFLEETGIDAGPWSCFCTETGRGYTVHFFRSRYDEGHFSIPGTNDAGEKLCWFRSDKIYYPAVGNLNWLIPMALDWRGMVAIVAARDDIRERPTW